MCNELFLFMEIHLNNASIHVAKRNITCVEEIGKMEILLYYTKGKHHLFTTKHTLHIKK